MYSFAAGSPGTYGGVGRISVKIYSTEEERQLALRAHERKLAEEAKQPQDTRTSQEKYDALNWDQFKREPEAPPAPFPWWGKLGIAAGVAAAALVILRVGRKR